MIGFRCLRICSRGTSVSNAVMNLWAGNLWDRPRNTASLEGVGVECFVTELILRGENAVRESSWKKTDNNKFLLEIMGLEWL